METNITDIYAAELLQHNIVRDSFNEISKHIAHIQDLIVIKESIEVFGLDSSVMKLINRDDMLVNELKLTQNDLNKSQEGLSDVFNQGIIKKITDSIRWLIDKIIEGIKWIWNKLTEWARSNKIDRAALQRAANNWDKLSDNTTLQPPDPSKPDIPWTNVPDFKECKNRLTLSKRLCEDFIKIYLNPLSEFAKAYIEESHKNPKCLSFYTLLTSNKFAHLRKNLNLSSRYGDKGKILHSAMSDVYREYIEKNKISPAWSNNEIVRIAEVRVKGDLGIKYKGEFNEVGTTIDDLEKSMNESKQTISVAVSSLTKIRAQFDTYAKSLIPHADYLDSIGDNNTAEMERNISARYNEEVAQLTDLLNTIVLVNAIIQRYLSIGTVNKLGLKELLDDIAIMFK